MVLPLALCQFVASYAATNMNVAISDIAHDLGTTVIGVQTAITLFTLTMAALMLPGSKMTDIWGRKRCFVTGLAVYGAGALVAALSPSLPVLVAGYSLGEGVGSALMIPPVYILLTVAFTDRTTRAKAFGAISAAAGVGAAAGPLIGGVITSGISWRASFLAQVALVAVILLLSRRIVATPVPESAPFDLGGAVLSGTGLLLIVIGFLMSGSNGWFVARKDVDVLGTTLIHEGGVSPTLLFILAGLLVLVWFVVHIGGRERRGREPLVRLALFRNHRSNLGLTTQFAQWLTMQGSFFVISVFLQQVRGYSAIEVGVILLPTTLGILASSSLAGRLARRRQQRTLVWAGFVVTILGMVLLLLLARATGSVLLFVPGLLFVGIGVGVMLTSSVNVVQSSFPDDVQGEISGLSRSVSNLGSSLGTAIAGSALVSSLVEGNAHFLLALVVLTVLAVGGLVAAVRLPPDPA